MTSQSVDLAEPMNDNATDGNWNTVWRKIANQTFELKQSTERVNLAELFRELNEMTDECNWERAWHNITHPNENI